MFIILMVVRGQLLSIPLFHLLIKPYRTVFPLVFLYGTVQFGWEKSVPQYPIPVRFGECSLKRANFG